ncbi:hypothetical protein [Motilibacter deserti]|uniref:Uncharacterized protein n=1 Tax=Motilibacter deserti TaxID=2714956 RepID=A0ABX0H2H3_9ACTN|nr:hypothetical protein [Motilibacter deserti]NHC16155.1 hypothetical protein [Motilibacter deserti]
MAYTPPSGWVEQLPRLPGGGSSSFRFHTRQDCRTIVPATTLQKAAQPYSAQRCRACAL